MTGPRDEIVRRDEIRLVEDTDGDGYADKATVLPSGFNSIQGLAYHDGTRLRDARPVPDGAARHATGTAWPTSAATCSPAWACRPRRTRPAALRQRRRRRARRLALPGPGRPRLPTCRGPRATGWCSTGGGILRCRPDGRDLHVFATGLRNIYDVALDAELNVFVRDNENDGGDYMIRVCHSFFGADHGYPYLYDERPDEALPPLADLGRGSSAGGVCYLETAVPGRVPRQPVLLRVGPLGRALPPGRAGQRLRAG